MLWTLILGAIFLIPFFSPDIWRVGSHSLYGLLAILLICFAFKSKNSLKDRSILPALIIWLIVVVMTSVLITYPRVALSQTLYFFLYALAFVVIAGLDLKRKTQLAAVLIAGSFFISLRVLMQHFFYFDEIIPYLTTERPPLTGRDLLFVVNMAERRRVISTFLTPNILASYLTMINLLIIGFMFGRLSHRWIGGVFPPSPRLRRAGQPRSIKLLSALLILNSYSLWLTRSLTGIAGFVFGLLLFSLFYFIKDRQRLKSASRLFIPFSIAMVILLILLVSRRFFYEGGAGNLVSSLQGRLQFWKTAFGIIAEKPLSFAGLGNFGYQYLMYAAPEQIKSLMAHNLILQLWIETGPYGLLAFFWFLSGLIMRAIKVLTEEPPAGADIRGLRAGALCALCAFIFHNMAGFSFFIPQTALLWWIVCALVID